MRLLIVGFNPGVTSFRVGHYYAHPGNRFYRLLYDSGLTPRLLRPEEDALLPSFGIGVTDLSSVPSVQASDLTFAQLRDGRAAVEALAFAHRPVLVCCNGFGVFRALCDRTISQAGLQESHTVAGVPVWVVPSSSGLASKFTAQRLASWRAMATYLDSFKSTLPPQNTVSV